MAVKTYDFKKVSLIVGTRALSGFADDGIQLEYDEDMWSIQKGADGEQTRSKSSDLSGKLTVNLMAASASNDYLSSLFAADAASGNGTIPILLKDNRGTTLASAATAWITKLPQVGFGKESGNRQWVLQTDELVLFVGGNT